jgi:hypothetical protein
MADALDTSLDHLAGAESSVVDLDGHRWACWQSWQRGDEYTTPHEMTITQRGDHLVIVATTRGTPVEEGGFAAFIGGTAGSMTTLKRGWGCTPVRPWFLRSSSVPTGLIRTTCRA